MAVRIRLRRMGKKKQPTYRVVVADARSPRDGRIIESIGRYDPRGEPSLVEIDNERARYWLGTGAQPTERVQKLLEISGAVAQPKVSRAGVYRLDDPPPSPPPEPEVTESPEGAAEPAAEEPAAEEPAVASEEDESSGEDQQEGAS
ncbi:MAG: 30S ribosomal protein S16 [bacterium]|nr:30S ribosomal protein S16 [bacterium]MYB44874.1 30S ribosomal protein S16 [Acidimicrobiia bacterium]